MDYAIYIDGQLADPAYEDLTWEVSPSGPVDVVTELATEFTFSGSDFTYLRATLKTGGSCAPVRLEVRHAGSVVYTGVLSMGSGKWSDRNGRVAFTPQVVARDAHLEDHAEDEINLLDLERVPPLRFALGAVSEAVICTRTGQGSYNNVPPRDCLPDDIAWTLVRLEEEEDETLQNSQTGPGTLEVSYFVKAVYRREEITATTPPGGGWTQVGPDRYARALLTGPPRVSTSSSFDQGTEESRFSRISTYPLVDDDPNLQPDNGVLLSTLLAALLSGSPYTIVSNFLGINPDGSAPDTRAYRAAAAYRGAVVFQKTDLTNADADENATIGLIALKDVWNLLAGLQVYPYVDEANVLRIEHLSYFTDTVVLDLSEAPEIRDATNFTYDREQVPRRETVSWMDEGTDPDFDGTDIIYDRYCATTDERPLKVERFSTNFRDMVNRPDDYDNGGFGILATFLYQGARYVSIAEAPAGDRGLVNAPFAWSVIQDALWRDGRPLKNAILNGRPVVFNSTVPAKEQEELSVPLLPDVFHGLDLRGRIRTQLGEAKVKKATYSSRSALFTFTPLLND